MNTVLDKIIADKRNHVSGRKRQVPLADLETQAKAAGPVRPFGQALLSAVQAGAYGLIAEIKKASPSKGLIRADFDPPRLAEAYAAGGATCLSVLTDTPYFQGQDSYLASARNAVDLPVLRKDFMIDPYQVVEARVLGADCILVIMAGVDDSLAAELTAAARQWGMDVLAEVHDRTELERAMRLEDVLLGVNNRNLKTLHVDLAVSESLGKDIPQGRLTVAESGLGEKADLDRMSRAGFQCFLVGESLMRQDDVLRATAALLGSKAPSFSRHTNRVVAGAS